MMEIGSILLAGFFFLLAAGYLRGQPGRSERNFFLKPTCRPSKAEKLETENRLKTALAKYRFAGSLIEELRKSHE